MTVSFVVLSDILLTGLLMLANRQATPVAAGRGFTVPFRAYGIGHLTCGFVASLVYPLLLVIFDRPITSFALGLLLIVLLWAGNRLKVAILSEVLVFSDVFLAGHALRYPRLYFGYAPLWVWPLAVGAFALLAWGVSLEPAAHLGSIGARIGAAAVILSVFAGFVALVRRPDLRVKAFLANYPLTFDTQTDAATYTPIGAALLHSLWHGQRRLALRERFCFEKRDVSSEEDSQGVSGESEKRHLLLVQAESLAPIGRLLGRPSVTPVLDRLAVEGTSGALELDWRGAYTMRSEFAVLTGLKPRELETYGFDPYRLAALVPMESLARRMKRLGYRTVVCHPNDGRFFDRNRVMPNLGFDEFIDLEALKKFDARFTKPEAYCGHYVSDEALLGWAAEYLEKAEEPVFLFVVTMEAHGPWSKDKFPGAEKLTEVERYETHLKHLDAGVRRIVEAEEGRKASEAPGRGIDLWLYGDHLPGLGVLRGREDEIPSDTLWVRWPRHDRAISSNMRPEQLMTINPTYPNSHDHPNKPNLPNF